MAEKILIGVDNSETALRAAEKAAELATAYGAKLHVLSAYTMNLNQTVGQSHPQAYKRVVDLYSGNAERTAQAVTEALRINYPDLEIITGTREGAPAFALLAEAESISADIIVVGNKRVQGPSRFLGSIARTISAEAECDLYIANTRQR